MTVEEWYRKYGEAVYRRCRRLSRNETLAWDLTQEVFLRAHRYQDSFEGRSSAMAWLFTIADRCFFDSLKKKEPVSAIEVEEFVREECEDASQTLARHDLVARLLSRAPKDVRQIVVHRYFDEWEHQQIAEALGINEKTVRRKLERFLERARKLASRK